MPSVKQQGFSLIELMIAMALGAFIIAGLVSVFISASQSYTTQQALVEIQDKGRFAIEKIRDDIQRAGLGLKSADDPVKLVAAGGTTDCNTNFEVLEIYYNENAAAVATLRCYYLDAGELKRNETTVGSAAPVATEIIIIDRIDQLDFLFAVDADGNGVDVIAGSLYQTAAGFTGAGKVADWNQVIGVRVELVVASNTDQVLSAAQVLVDPFGGGNLEYDDSRLHQAYTALVSLRNRLL